MGTEFTGFFLRKKPVNSVPKWSLKWFPPPDTPPQLAVILLLKFLIEESYILISGSLGDFGHRKHCLLQQVSGGL